MRVTIIELKLTTNLHLIISLSPAEKRIVLKRNPPIIPIARNKLVITPKIPFLLIYFGEIYLT